MKAYSITAPEEIAKEYGGNKRKIQQAAAQGLINPTEAVMAGMFIDRMRNAAMQEQAQQPTVAEQVMNPQPQMPSAGLATAPQAGQMQQPMAPRMGQPTASPMPQPAQAQMAQGAPVPPQQPRGMAMGGGLDAIPYNEGSYAPGGVVSFNVAGSVYAQAMSQLRNQLANTRIQSERDKISGQMEQLRAQYEQPSLVPGDDGVNIDDLVRQNVGQPIRQGLNNLGSGIQAGFNALTSAFSSGDTDEFNRAKNARAEVDPAEQARLQRVALAQQTTGEGQNVVPVDTSDPFAMDMESFEDAQRATGQTAPMRSTDLSLAAQQSIIAQLSPEQKARRAGLGEITSPEALAMLGENKGTGANETFLTPEDIARLRKSQIKPQGIDAIASPMTSEQAISALGERKGTGANETFVKAPTVEEPTVAEQVQKTQKQTADFTGLGTESESGEETAAAAGTPAERNKQMIDPNETVDQYITRMMGQLPKEAEGPLTTRLKDRIANQAENMKGAKKDAMWMAVLETGVGMLAQGGGQTMFQALGKAAGPALKNYASTLKDIKKEDLDLLKHGVAMEAADKKAKAEITKQLVANFGAEQTARINRESQERISDARNEVLAEGYRIQADAQNLDIKGLAALISKDRKARNMPALSNTELYGLAEMTLQQNKNFRAQQQALTARMPALQQKANEAASEAVANFMDIQVGAQNPQRMEYDKLDQRLRTEQDPATRAQIQDQMNTILEEIRTKARAQAMEGVMGGINQAPSPLIIGTGADGSAIGSNADVNARLSAYPQ